MNIIVKILQPGEMREGSDSCYKLFVLTMFKDYGDDSKFIGENDRPLIESFKKLSPEEQEKEIESLTLSAMRY